MSSSDLKVGDKVWVKLDSVVEELATIVKLPSTNILLKRYQRIQQQTTSQ